MHCSSERLNAYMEGALPGPEEQRVSLHIEECRDCQRTLDELQQLDAWTRQKLTVLKDFCQEELGTSAPVERFHQWRETRQTRTKWWIPWLALPATLMLGFFILPGLWNLHKPARLIVKGQRPIVFLTYAHRQFKKPLIAKKVRSGQVLFPGDYIQFSYQSLEPFYLLVMSINTHGQIATIMSNPQSDGILLPKGKGTFPNQASFDLDQTIGFERFYVITSKRPISQQKVRLYLEKYRRRFMQLVPDKLGSWYVHTILIEKRKR